MQNAKLEQLAECDEVKRLSESRIVSVPTDFNESDFDKPIIFVLLTMAHVSISSPRLCLSACWEKLQHLLIL